MATLLALLVAVLLLVHTPAVVLGQSPPNAAAAAAAVPGLSTTAHALARRAAARGPSTAAARPAEAHPRPLDEDDTAYNTLVPPSHAHLRAGGRAAAPPKPMPAPAADGAAVPPNRGSSDRAGLPLTDAQRQAIVRDSSPTWA